MLNTKVQAILASVDRLHPIPSNVTRILKEMDSPDVTIAIIAEYLGLDQALTALTIQVSNSVGLGYSRNCSTLQEAVMRIGLKRLKSILMAAAALGSVNQSLAGYRLGAGDLWNHALATAIASEKLAGVFGLKKREEAYVAGMLHDIGKLLLDQFVLTDYTKILNFMNQYKMPLWQAESKLIGVDHAQVGGLMGERWDFPAPLIETIRYHHYPVLAQQSPVLPAVVNLANSLVSGQGYGQSGLVSTELHPETLTILRLSADDLRHLTEKFPEMMANC
jgi:putative nucleotidyltransferase with HDIG domain